MAKSTIRFRFVFNRGGGSRANEVRREARAAVNGEIEDIVFRYAKGTFESVKTAIKNRIERDVMTEASFMAGLMKRSFIGIAGIRAAPNGGLGMAHPAMTQLGIRAGGRAGAGVQWSPRSPKYMDWKQRHGYGNKWFKNEGQTLAGFLGKASNWTSSFGPVQVSITRNASGSGSSSLGQLSFRERTTTRRGYTRYKSLEDSTNIKAYVANIKVSALGRITPQMLPGLASGSLGGPYPDGRQSGLLASLPGEVAHRLGGRANYRPTVEPFLTFFLTQAVPNALFLRVQEGLKANLSPLTRKS